MGVYKLIGYDCKLTDLNKSKFRDMIYNLYTASIVPTDEISMIVIVWMFEYFCAYFFINTEQEVSIKLLQKRLVGKYVKLVPLSNILHGVRNNLVHTPYLGIRSANAVQTVNTEGNIRLFCSVFEEDTPKFERIYRSCMETLGCYKDGPEILSC